jgi:carbon-monoxide dehydrogenase medium subunit
VTQSLPIHVGGSNGVTATTLDAAEVVVPTSREDAVSAFGDGTGVTVVGGGTILMPEINYGRLRPERVLLLHRAGLAGIRRNGSTLTIGATTPVAELEAGPEPLATMARHVADVEVRAQATLGGNLCAQPGGDHPRGDLQAALIALGAHVRTTGAGGERAEPVEDFLAGDGGRLVLEVDLEAPRRAGHASVRRPHAHAYTILAVCVAETTGGVRVGITGAAPRAVRAGSVEQALADGASSADAAARVDADVRPGDDALASAWYRARMLPVLVRRALEDMGQ